MRTDRETVTTGALAEPRVEVAVTELDDKVAAFADEVVVVPFAAQPVAGLAGMVAQRVDCAATSERRERPVNGRQADALSLAGEHGVDLLRRRVVLLGSQHLQDGEPLPGGAQAVAAKQRNWARVAVPGSLSLG